MEFISRYIAKPPNKYGFVNYTQDEDLVWHTLYTRQIKLLHNRACDEFIQGLEILKLSQNAIPQLPDVSAKLSKATGWIVSPVAALISARNFFQLLAQRQFPAATFIRTLTELDYIQEPDIFHELFGHCPLLTDLTYANFMQQYAAIVLSFPESEWPLLQRLFWFTVEFGLIITKSGLRAYGGGILSSINETVYSIESDLAMRVLFNPVTVLRTPYRIDQLQKIYFVIDNYKMLYSLLTKNIAAYMQHAKELGEYPPMFTVERNNPNIHILAC